MKKCIIVTLCLLLVGAVLFGCSSGTIDTNDVMDFYIEYLETWKNDRENAAQYRFHNNSLRSEIIFKEALTWDELYQYEVRSVEQLNEKLWVILVWTESAATPDGYEYYNFVGVIDGKLFVMGNYTNVPDDLSGALDLQQYSNPNAAYPDSGKDYISIFD